MQKLGANTIRVYHVDGAQNHTDCMSTFADAGIYLFVDLDTFTTQIEQVWTIQRKRGSVKHTDAIGVDRMLPTGTKLNCLPLSGSWMNSRSIITPPASS